MNKNEIIVLRALLRIAKGKLEGKDVETVEKLMKKEELNETDKRRADNLIGKTTQQKKG